MPLYNNISNWNGLEIQVNPLEQWRKKIPFWPYFIGQKIQLEIVISKPGTFEKVDLQFHAVEKMASESKPRIISLIPKPDLSSDQIRVFSLENGSMITGGGTIQYWLSNRGYNVDSDPIFTTEAINLDSFVIPFLLLLIGPFLCFLGGLVLGLLMGS